MVPKVAEGDGAETQLLSSMSFTAVSQKMIDLAGCLEEVFGAILG